MAATFLEFAKLIAKLAMEPIKEISQKPKAKKTKKYASWHNPKNKVTYSQLHVALVAGGVPPDLLRGAEVGKHLEGWPNGPRLLAELRPRLVKAAWLSPDTVAGGPVHKGMFVDMVHVERYFSHHGARILDPTFCDGPDRQSKQKLEELLKTDCNNRLFYFSGHGSGGENPFLQLSKSHDSRLTFQDLLAMLKDARPTGTLTIVLDCCYAGSWALAFGKLAADQTHWLHEQGDEQQSLMINLRMSCLPSEKAGGPETGGCFTGVWLDSLTKEDAELADMPGYGTRILRIDSKLPSIKVANQTSCSADFVFGNHRGQAWAWCSPVELKKEILRSVRTRFGRWVSISTGSATGQGCTKREGEME